MKKLLALVCSIVMCVSMIASTALVADASGATATLEFAGYETKGAATFAVIKVKASIPETLVPYQLIGADWVTTFEDVYEGKMIQTVGFVIPNVDGLVYTASLSSAASYVQIQDNKTAKNVTIYAANTGAYDTYYAGEVDELATLYYRISGDVNAQYDLALTDAVIGLVDIAADGSATPREYTFGDFAVTNAVVKPAVTEPEDETVEMAAPAYMTEATASEETAGWQVGQGVALKFTVADLAEFVAMNWKLTCENIGTKYAKVADEDFAAIKASSADTIDVFASFIVNSKDAKETVNAITAVGAGFKKADGTVVETK